MARPPFTPNARQQRLIARLGRQLARIRADDSEFTLLIAHAKEQGIPIEHIAKAAGVTVKTVYNRLGRIAR